VQVPSATLEPLDRPPGSELAAVRRRAAASLSERCGPLLAAAATGDHAAFDELYQLVSPRLFGVVLGVLRDHAQAEEVCQEVFLEIWQRSSRYDEARGSACAWMTTIAHRRAVDRVRTAESSSRRDTHHHLGGYVPLADDTAQAAGRHLEAEQVRAAMGRLSVLQRGALELAFHGGYTHREVAVLLAVPVGTAKARIRDGLTRLRTELAAA